MQVENLRQSNLEMKETIEEKDAEMAEYMATMGQVKPSSSMNFFLIRSGHEPGLKWTFQIL